MDWNRVEGNWKQVKGKIKEQWGRLTDDDLDVIAGKRDQLEGKIQERYGIEKDRVRRDVDDWYGRQGWLAPSLTVTVPPDGGDAKPRGRTATGLFRACGAARG